VTAIRKETAGRAQPWSWPELEEAAKTPVNAAPSVAKPAVDTRPPSP
jgi:hypothetical protein